MKKYLFVILLSLGFSVMAENLLKNGNFESGAKFWKLNQKSRIDKDVYHDGKNSLFIASNKSEPTRIYYGESIKVEPGSNYAFSVWIKTKQVEKIEIRIIPYDKDGKYLTGKELALLELSGDQNWVKIESGFNSGKAAKLSLICKSFGKGQVWFDELELRKGSPSRSVNLLRNSSFKFESNPGLPDFWICTPISQQLSDIAFGEWGIDQNEQSPVPGTKAVSLKGKNTFHATSIRNIAKDKHCFSVYLKSDHEKSPVTITILKQGKGGSKTSPSWTCEIGKEWKRHSFQCDLEGGAYITRFIFPKKTRERRIWIAAPQLLRGDDAPAWQESDFDRNHKPLLSQDGEDLEKNLAKINCDQVNAKPVLDGSLDDACWKNLERIKLKDIFNWTASPSLSTELMLCRDNENLYVAFACERPKSAKHTNPAKLKKDNSALFGNDAVELFIAQSALDARYFHFATDSFGNMYDARGRSPVWNADWKAVAKLDGIRWSTEIAIPLSVFRGYDGQTWRFNFCRSGVSGPGTQAFSWSDAKGFHNPQKFGYVTGMLPISDEIFIKRVFLSKDQFEDYQFRCYFNDKTVPNVKNIVFNISKDGKSLFKTEIPQLLGHELNISIPSSLSSQLPSSTFILKTDSPGLKKNEWSFCDLLSPLAVYNPDLDVYPELSYYTNKDENAKIRIEAATKIFDELSFSLTDLEKTVFQKTIKLSNGNEKIDINIPLSNLNIGEYQIVLKAFKNKKLLAIHNTRKLIKVPFKKGLVRINHFKRCLVNESNNFIPRIYYPVKGGGGSLREEELSILPKYHFNAVKRNTDEFKNKKSLSKDDWSEIREYLSLCEKNKIKTLIDPTDVATKLNRGTFNLEQATRQNEIMVSELSSPAILAWVILHEPNSKILKGATEYDLTLLYKRLKKRDPYHPVTGIFTPCGVDQKGEPFGTIACLDFPMVDIYPFRAGSPNPLREYARQAEKLNESTRCLHLPSGIMLQSFFFDYIGNREPRPKEWQNMVYQSLIFGTRIFSHFIAVPQSKELWNKMIEVNRQLQEFSDILLSPETKEIESTWLNDDIVYALWTQDNKAYLMIANLSYKSIVSQFDLKTKLNAKIKNAKAMFGALEAKLGSGKLKITLPPASSACYVLEISSE